MSKQELSIISLVLFLYTQCESPDRHNLLQGTWSVDSIYTFYNGFDFVRQNTFDEPDLSFQEDDMGFFILADEQRSFIYELPHTDTLSLTTQSGIKMSTFSILQLDERRLVLRQEKRIPFKGEGQQRFEIRYLSKVDVK